MARPGSRGYLNACRERMSSTLPPTLPPGTERHVMHNHGAPYACMRLKKVGGVRHSVDICFGDLLGGLWGLLGTSWGVLGASWAPLGGSSGPLGGCLGFLGDLLGHPGRTLGASRAIFGASLGLFVESLASLGGSLGPSGGHLGAKTCSNGYPERTK